MVWAYVLEHGVQYLETHREQTERIADQWLARAGSASGTVFTRVKRASIFGDRSVPSDNDTGAVMLNANILEAVVSDLVRLRVTNARNGVALLGNFVNRTTNIKHPYDMGEFDLSDEWIRLYMVWNLGFVCGSNKPEVFAKLLIPSVVTGTGRRWLSHRVWAMRMTIMSDLFMQIPKDWNLDDLGSHFAHQGAVIRFRVHQPGPLEGWVKGWVKGVMRRSVFRVVRSMICTCRWIEYMV